jgi:hypothetical protein
MQVILLLVAAHLSSASAPLSGAVTLARIRQLQTARDFRSSALPMALYQATQVSSL